MCFYFYPTLPLNREMHVNLLDEYVPPSQNIDYPYKMENVLSDIVSD